MSKQGKSKRGDLAACREAMQRVLDEHGCALVGVPQFKADRAGGWLIDTRIEIVARP